MIYSMCLTGHAAEVAGSPTVLKAVTTVSSNSLITKIGSDGVGVTVNPTEGGKAFFESEVSFTGATTFEESGSIGFGDGNHRLRISTVGGVYLANCADPRLKHGSIIWRIGGGARQFAQSTGLITSNFTVSDAGEVVDNQFGLIFLK